MATDVKLYDTPAARLNTILGPKDFNFWMSLRKAFEQDMPATEGTHNFTQERIKHAIKHYGIKLSLTEGGIADGFHPSAEVVDEQKYLIFLLKYTNNHKLDK